MKTHAVQIEIEEGKEERKNEDKSTSATQQRKKRIQHARGIRILQARKERGGGVAPRRHVNTSSVELFDVMADSWPKELMDWLYVDRLHPCSTTPQAIRTIPMSHELPTARTPNQLHGCVALVDAVTWICFALWFSVYSWFYCPKVECCAFIWNQLVYVLLVRRRKAGSHVFSEYIQK